jgi:ATP-dependent DNA helicase DinG
VEEKLNHCYEITDRVFGEGGLLSQKISGYEIRHSQVEGIKKCIKSLLENGHMILEGATGFGKSYTYLFSSVIISMIEDKRILLCTSGITLQNQLEQKDLPTVIECLYEVLGAEEIKNAKFKPLMSSSEPPFISLKGRVNYLCNKRYDSMYNNLMVKRVRKAEDEELQIFDHIKNGCTELGELPFVPNYKIWEEFSCKDKTKCSKKECKYFKTPKCKYTYYRNVLPHYPILLVNYHMLFSSIMAGGILGDFDIMVFDEAHEIPKIARNFLTTTCSVGTITGLQNDVADILNNNEYNIDTGMNTRDKIAIRDLARDVDESFERIKESFQRELHASLELKVNSNTILTKPVPESEVETTIKSAKILNIRLGEMVEIFQNYATEDTMMNYFDDYQDDGDPLGMISKDMEEVWNGVSGFFSEFTNIITLAEKDQKVYYAKLNENNTIYLCSTPIKVDTFMRNNIFYPFNEEISTITTSATLTTNNNFDYIRDELGLTDNVNEFIGESPFDMENQQLLYMPPDNVSLPANDPAFTKYSIDTAVELAQACDGGLLALFTSIYAMNRAASEIRYRVPSKNVLVQGEHSREHILKVFAEDEDSILIATKSFFTGIDVRGRALRCVFLDKLPFETPDDPIVKALENKNGFMEYCLPNMIIALKQAFGRGIRSRTDKAIVCVADNRLSTARYKGKIKNSFGYPISSTKTIDKVKMFIHQEGGNI